MVMSILGPLPFELEVHNLRSFTGKPARLELDGGFTALLGINNAGKSSLLRMFWELRPVLGSCRRPSVTRLQRRIPHSCYRARH